MRLKHILFAFALCAAFLAFLPAPAVAQAVAPPNCEPTVDQGCLNDVCMPREMDLCLGNFSGKPDSQNVEICVHAVTSQCEHNQSCHSLSGSDKVKCQKRCSDLADEECVGEASLASGAGCRPKRWNECIKDKCHGGHPLQRAGCRNTCKSEAENQCQEECTSPSRVKCTKECTRVPHSMCANAVGGDTISGQTKMIGSNYVVALQMMAEHLSAVAMQHTQSIGALFDAKNKLEAEQDQRLLVAEAHKDYHPSEIMCEFGSFVRSIAQTDEKTDVEKQSINRALMNTYLNKTGSASAAGASGHINARMQQFRTTYCDPADNNSALAFMCDHDQKVDKDETQTPGVDFGAQSLARVNKDIDYLGTVVTPLTLDINYTDNRPSEDEEDVLSLARHLYWPETLSIKDPRTIGRKDKKYLDARTLFAMKNVAHNSFANITALKSSADPAIGEQGGWNYMKALLRDFGLTEEEIHTYLGNYPSYYAQMEVLTKKIYQSPDFYTNLTDKPANIERISAAMEAIKIMQGRDYLDASLRKEMLLSLMIEEALADEILEVNAGMNLGITASQ